MTKRTCCARVCHSFAHTRRRGVTRVRSLTIIIIIVLCCTAAVLHKPTVHNTCTSYIFMYMLKALLCVALCRIQTHTRTNTHTHVVDLTSQSWMWTVRFAKGETGAQAKFSYMLRVGTHRLILICFNECATKQQMRTLTNSKHRSPHRHPPIVIVMGWLSWFVCGSLACDTFAVRFTRYLCKMAQLTARRARWAFHFAIIAYIYNMHTIKSLIVLLTA